MRGEEDREWKEENMKSIGTRYESNNKRNSDGIFQFLFFMLRNPTALWKRDILRSVSTLLSDRLRVLKSVSRISINFKTVISVEPSSSHIGISRIPFFYPTTPSSTHDGVLKSLAYISNPKQPLGEVSLLGCFIMDRLTVLTVQENVTL